MALTKNLVVNVINETEGITLTIKTVSVGDNGITITGDPGLYNIEEVLAALEECKKFTRSINEPTS
jgi:hypothetical protein